MRHQTEDVALLVADSRYVVARSVWVGRVGCAPPDIAITEENPAFELKAMEDVVISKIAALAMSDRKSKDRSRPGGIGKGTVVALDAYMDVLANEMQSAISDERARKQSRFAQDLKAVANADDDSAVGSKGLY